MSTESPFEARAEILRAVDAFVDLDVRIARLCHALGVDIRTDDDIRHIIERSAPGFEQAPTHLQEGVGQAPDRQWVEQEELRGLLVVRCDLLRHTVQEWGLETTREITAMAETALAQRGFRPGADGFVMLKLLER